MVVVVVVVDGGVVAAAAAAAAAASCFSNRGVVLCACVLDRSFHHLVGSNSSVKQRLSNQSSSIR